MWLVSSRTFSTVRTAGATRLRTSTRMMTVAQRVVDISVPFQRFSLSQIRRTSTRLFDVLTRKSLPRNEKSPAGTWPAGDFACGV